MPEIPRRASNEKDFPGLTAKERDYIAYAIVFREPNEKAFILFYPEFADAVGKITKAGKDKCKDFWQYSKVREYADAYRATLAKALLGEKQTERMDDSAEIDGSRKDNALKSLLNQAMLLVEKGEDLDADSLKTISEIFKKVGLLKDEVEEEIKPLRFLPERCFSGCRYRLFVENAVKGGSVIDECQFCKALAYATENGYKDDSTKRLNIPKEVLDAEPENTVKTLDIISGKIEN